MEPDSDIVPSSRSPPEERWEGKRDCKKKIRNIVRKPTEKASQAHRKSQSTNNTKPEWDRPGPSV